VTALTRVFGAPGRQNLGLLAAGVLRLRDAPGKSVLPVQLGDDKDIANIRWCRNEKSTFG
jgi:hypothetical protein